STALRQKLRNCSDDQSVSGLNMVVFRKEAEAMQELAKRFLSGEKLNPNISTQTYTLYLESQDGNTPSSASDPADLLRLLRSLESEVRYAAVLPAAK
ncbi:MAG: hypothetical protein JO141_05430, partial [Bradyrhizobium sp.]|nr:hypothetical protein [Bradyrhizobium sp.]